MTVRLPRLALFALTLIPSTSVAGPIQFGYATGNISTSPWAPELGLTLQPFQPPGPIWDFDPAAQTPVSLPAVYAVPAMLPTPAARDIHPDGTTHWNNDGYFSVDVTVFDFASDQFATVRFGGRGRHVQQLREPGRLERCDLLLVPESRRGHARRQQLHDLERQPVLSRAGDGECLGWPEPADLAVS